MRAEYQCVRCKAVFEGPHFRDQRLATGRTVEHCGEPARWLRNLEESNNRTLNPTCTKCGAMMLSIFNFERVRTGFECPKCGHSREVGFRRLPAENQTERTSVSGVDVNVPKPPGSLAPPEKQGESRRRTAPPASPFHTHLDACQRCRDHPFDLCAVGDRLLQEAGQKATEGLNGYLERRAAADNDYDEEEQ